MWRHLTSSWPPRPLVCRQIAAKRLALAVDRHALCAPLPPSTHRHTPSRLTTSARFPGHLAKLASGEDVSQLASGLYIVATPIGNLEDISFRALRVLRSSSMILAEDTRHTRKLLNYFGIATPLTSCNEHKEHERTSQVLRDLAGGAAVALVSDAGLPTISDPGSSLIKAAIAAQHTVVPIPGPSAFLTALVASGLDTSEFRFVGFLPPKSLARQRKLHQLAVLSDCQEAFGQQRKCCVARELTKVYEEFFHGSLKAAADKFEHQTPKGEFTLVIEGVPATARDASDDQRVEAELEMLMQQGMSTSRAAKQVAAMMAVPRSKVYDVALTIQAEKNAATDPS